MNEVRPTQNVIADLAPKDAEEGRQGRRRRRAPGLRRRAARASTTTARARAAILEIAEQMAAGGRSKAPGEPGAVRVLGRGGVGAARAPSTTSASLSAAEKAKIGLNLNFDMLGSPNFVRFVYDGDGSDERHGGPVGLG